MGILEHLARLRRQQHWPGISEVYCSPKLGIWWRRDAKHHHDMLEHATPPGFFQGRGTRCHQSREIGDLPEAELHLVMLTTPTLADSDYGNLDTLAFHYGLTPAQTQALLDGNDIDTGAPPACPPAERCLAICSRLQHTGRTAFPISAYGNYEKCRYYHFLAAHGEQDSESRAMHAQQLVDRISHRNGRSTPRPPEPETTEADITAPVVQQTLLGL